MSIVFGPIPSRRLGRSLGINNISYKSCSYSCVYCQLGLTDSMTVLMRNFFPVNEIIKETGKKLNELSSAGEEVDYITVVPDGEPTLDINLGVMIQKLKSFGKKIAVITNASMLWDKNIRNELMNADWVSVKIDSASSTVWKKINRPHGMLRLPKILNGIKKFAFEYEGTLVTETMLVKDLNVGIGSLRKTAAVIKSLNPGKAYILIPTRPPAESFAVPPDESKINLAYQIFKEYEINVELLTGYEGNDFSYSSNAEKELLDILNVHPMRKDAVMHFLDKANCSWELIDNLVAKKLIKETEYSKKSYILRKY